MKKNDLMQIELTVTKALAPIIKLVDKHETAIEDEQTDLKGRVQRTEIVSPAWKNFKSR
jgi:hypothetical protein